MTLTLKRTLLTLALAGASVAAHAGSEVTLFSSTGLAQAYIADDEDNTLYLWDGKPVAYLTADEAGGQHVYGFNGRHLGWLVDGVIRDHQGNKTCATASALGAAGMEPTKIYKRYKPNKLGLQYAPLRPLFTDAFSAVTCKDLLAQGSYS